MLGGARGFPQPWTCRKEKKRMKVRRHLWILLVLLVAALPAFAGDHQRAIDYYNRAVRLKGPANDPVLLFKKEQLYKRAIELWPGFPEAHNNLGDVYEKEGRFEKAIAEYKKALRLAPNAAYPYFGLGDVYFKTGRKKEAIAWYRKGLAINPEDALTRKRLSLLEEIAKAKVVKAKTIKRMLNSDTRAIGETVSLTFGEGLIPFDFDKADIRPDARPQLDEIGKALRALTSARPKDIAVVEKEEGTTVCYEIAGHTDSRGSDAYNLRLSRRRAQAVVDYLVKNFGIPRDRLIPKGYGERRPLCTEGTEACYALNRRVEVIKRKRAKKGRGVGTRGVSSDASLPGKSLTVDLGLFYQPGPGGAVYPLRDEGTTLHSHRDRYFAFLRPMQDCYCYLLQEDAKGHVDLLYPKEGDGFVKSRSDVWVPGFGKAYTLDETTGEEKLYLLVSARSIKAEIEGLSLKESAQRAVRAFGTRAIYIVKAPREDAPVPQAAVSHAQQDPHSIDAFLERIEGEGAWVRVVRFEHL